MIILMPTTLTSFRHCGHRHVTRTVPYTRFLLSTSFVDSRPHVLVKHLYTKIYIVGLDDFPTARAPSQQHLVTKRIVSQPMDYLLSKLERVLFHLLFHHPVHQVQITLRDRQAGMPRSTLDTCTCATSIGVTIKSVPLAA